MTTVLTLKSMAVIAPLARSAFDFKSSSPMKNEEEQVK